MCVDREFNAAACLCRATLGDGSCIAHWERKNQPQVERCYGFQLKILLGSSWSAPTELRPQTGVSCNVLWCP